MNPRTRQSHRSATALTAGLVGVLATLAAALTPTAAHASRIPADPVTSRAQVPAALARAITDNHSARVRAALQELRDDVNGPS